jgi:integrase
MTFRVKKRGKIYRLEGRAGDVANLRAHRGAGERERVRLSLGTENGGAAQLLHGRVERAMAEGPSSATWRDLRTVLPTDTFAKLAQIAGYVPDQEMVPECTWTDIVAKFKSWMSRRVALDKLRESTRERHLQTCAAFGEFLRENGIADLDEIKRATIEDFKSWKLARILAKKHSRGGRGVVLDVAILHRIFAFAIDDCELVLKNPVRLDGRPGDRPEFGAQPFSADQLLKLRKAAGEDMLAFLLLRHTGFRASDIVRLRLGEIDWDTREINRLTLKRRKRVVLPIHSELFFALEVERDSRGPDPDPEERLLMNPATGRPLTRPRLYQRMLALGKRAGVLDSHPHRFRDTFAVDFLAKGGSPYDVAKLLGDTVETVERHYAPFVRELRERARGIIETGKGLEIVGTPRAQEKMPDGKPN